MGWKTKSLFLNVKVLFNTILSRCIPKSMTNFFITLSTFYHLRHFHGLPSTTSCAINKSMNRWIIFIFCFSIFKWSSEVIWQVEKWGLLRSFGILLFTLKLLYCAVIASRNIRNTPYCVYRATLVIGGFHLPKHYDFLKVQ